MTSADPTANWLEANQRYLTAALAVVGAALERHAAQSSERGEETVGSDAARRALQAAAEALSAPPALDTLCRTFGLSPFERDVLLLSAGVELDSRFAPLCAAAQGDAARTYPTFSLALAALPDPHWSALTPAGPLRHWRLIELGAGSSLVLSPLRIDECVLHFLTGTPHLDERLVGLVEPVPSGGELVPSQAALVSRIVAAWSHAAGRSALPVIQLCGDEPSGQRAIAAAACAALGLGLSRMSTQQLPTGAGELDALLRLWGRQAALGAMALLLDCEELDVSDAARAGAAARLIERMECPLLVAARDRRPVLDRWSITLDVSKPSRGEQRTLWQCALGGTADRGNGQVDRLVAQFDLSAQAIQAACAEALAGCEGSEPDSGEPGEPREASPLPSAQTAALLPRRLWDACRAQTRPRLNDLAQRIEPMAEWRDLVVPAGQRELLSDMALYVRHRVQVYETWGFAARGQRGLGLSALFAGASGTGKTMAAEVLANELRLDLYRIDLSQVVSKYIGETEKNLRRVFDAAEEGGAILLFDEADALFGKRSEVKDSHDRYANIEVSYLLQRMEAYRGLAILTTNMKNALDAGFLRRLRFVVHFPFPDAAQRAEIWRRVFPARTPTEGLQVEKLARLNVAGGNIRNIALTAAFLAAEAGEPVRMGHVLRAARGEYAKLERPLTDAEIGGWV